MSLYAGHDGDAGLAMGAQSADMSMMGHDAGIMNGLDLDMNLPMDLDLDLSGTGDSAYTSIASRQHQHLGNSANDSLQDQALVSSNPNASFTSRSQQQDAPMTGAGAGPLPTGFGMQPPGGTGTLTEFTKRRNWSQRIIDELKDFLHILTPDGRILYVSPSCKSITGYEAHVLIGKFIGEYVHPDDGGIFMREFNESIASGNSLRFFYRFKKEDGTYMIFECDGHPHITPEPLGASNFGQTPANQSLAVGGLCRGFFMMARPYPTKNAALLDSFLEHKIENERLMKRIEELKREEAQENAEQDRLYRENATSQSVSPSESHVTGTRAQGDGGSEGPAETPNYQGMPPPAKPPISNTALTRQNLDSALSSTKPDSIADKMSRYEANSTHLEGIELLTGLRYRDGERSHGISTGDTSPALIRGDAGIAIMLDRDRESSKKEKKKFKIADEYVCADCGTLDSPEWRKGPKGPKTLCNACGLRWAKKEKKRGGDESKTDNSPGNGGGMANQQPLPPAGTTGLAATGQTPGLPVPNSIGSGNSA